MHDASYASRLHEILHDAFLPYRSFYTKEAFDATVVSTDTIEKRINSSAYSVYGAFVEGELAGTVTSKLTGTGDLYFMSMAVLPRFAGRGIGNALLTTLKEEAIETKCRFISLDTYEPLTHAIRLYEHFGFRRTGKSKDYSGIVVFEMKMKIETRHHFTEHSNNNDKI